MSILVKLPEPLVDTLRTDGVNSIEATVNVAVTARHGKRTDTIVVRPNRFPKTALPESGELQMRLDTAMPSVTVGNPGDVVFAVKGISPALKLDAGKATDVTCSSESAGNLATVAVGGEPVQLQQPPQAPAVPTAAGINVGYFVDNTVARIKKLGSNLSIGRGRFDAVTSITPPYPITGDIKLPAANGYFITFRFVPTTSRVEMIQGGESKGSLSNVEFIDGGGLAGDVKMTIKLITRLRDVRVDGVPLNVGPSCQSATPALIDMNARLVFKRDTDSVKPVKVKSTFTLPKFSGCGVTENLDPLLTGLISGPGNTMTTTLVLRCFSDQCTNNSSRGGSPS